MPGPLEVEASGNGEHRATDEEEPIDPERLAMEAISPTDSEGDANADLRQEMPIEADGLDSDSVFLGAADGDLDDPGAIRPLPADEEAESDTEKPTSPFNSGRHGSN